MSLTIKTIKSKNIFLIHNLSAHIGENSTKMILRKIAILLPLFIFGEIAQVCANTVKSINNTTHQEMIIKMDENRVVMQKKTGSTKGPGKTVKNRKDRFQWMTPYTDYEAIMGSTKFEIKFLKTLEEKKGHLLKDFMDKVIYSYEFDQNAWRDKLLSFRKGTQTKPMNSDFGQSISKSYPDENKDFIDGGLPATFKLLQSKRPEIFKELFVGIRFSFDPMSGNMFLEVNLTPSSNKRSGFIIPF